MTQYCTQLTAGYFFNFFSRELDGYFLDGFHSGGPAGLKVNVLDEIAPILKDIFLILDSEKPRLYLGMCDPKQILDLVSLGVDMFESSYAYHATQHGLALDFKNSLSVPKEIANENCPTRFVRNILRGFHVTLLCVY